MKNQNATDEAIEMQWNTKHGGATLGGAYSTSQPCEKCGKPLTSRSLKFHCPKTGWEVWCRECYLAKCAIDREDERTACLLQEAGDVMAELKAKENSDA